MMLTHEKRRRRYVAPIALIALVACEQAHEGLPYYRSADLTPEWVSAATANAPSMHRVSAFAFLNQNGITVTDTTLRDRVTLVHFFYASCGRVCPRAFDSIQRMLAGMETDSAFQVLSYTVQPERDSVAALKAYAELHHLTDGRWHLLTGPWDTVDKLARNSYFVNLRDGRSYGTDDLAHTETLVLIDKQSRIRGVYNATLPLDMQQAASDARTLLASP